MPTSTLTEPRPVTSEGREEPASRPGTGPVLGLLVLAVLAGALFAYSLTDRADVDAGSPTEQLRAWLEDNPNDAVAWRRLGDLYLVDAVPADDTAGFLAADRALRRAADIDPTSIDTARSLSVASVGLHRFDDGAAFAEQVLARRPDDLVALASLADAQAQLGNYDDSLATSELLVALRPEAGSYARLSFAEQMLGGHDEATDLMFAARTAAENAPIDRARTSLFLGELFTLAGDRTAAAEHYELASEVAEIRPRAVLGLAELAASAGEIDRAEELLSSSGIDAAGLAVFEARARLAAALDDDEALAEQLRSIRSVVDTSLAADIGIEPSTVLIEADLGDPSRAIRLGDQLLAAQPGNIHAHHARAWAAHLDGDATTARAHTDQALRTGAVDPLLFAHAALVLSASGDDRAQVLLDRAIATDSEVVSSFHGLTEEMFVSAGLTLDGP